MKFLKYILIGIGLVLVPVLVYFIVAVGGSFIPVNTNQPDQQDYVIYIETNGVHTDIVVPLKSEIKDWTQLVDLKHSVSGRTDFTYVAFGWGDLQFYQNTPQWSDVTLSIAFKSLFLKTPAAMHVKFKNVVVENDRSISIPLTKNQYRDLSAFIESSFDLDASGKPKLIEGLHYHTNDVFYKATGSLNLFYTCNTWTNSALKNAGLRASLWTPFSEGIFYMYP